MATRQPGGQAAAPVTVTRAVHGRRTKRKKGRKTTTAGKAKTTQPCRSAWLRPAPEIRADGGSRDIPAALGRRGPRHQDEEVGEGDAADGAGAINATRLSALCGWTPNRCQASGPSAGDQPRGLKARPADRGRVRWTGRFPPMTHRHARAVRPGQRAGRRQVPQVSAQTVSWTSRIAGTGHGRDHDDPGGRTMRLPQRPLQPEPHGPRPRTSHPTLPWWPRTGCLPWPEPHPPAPWRTPAPP